MKVPPFLEKDYSPLLHNQGIFKWPTSQRKEKGGKGDYKLIKHVVPFDYQPLQCEMSWF